MTVKRKAPQSIVGTVTSDRMDKTIVVQAVHMVQHRVYRKYIRETRTYKAHDAENAARAGARVRIAATRPLSKTKRWRLVESLEQGPEQL